MSIRWRVTFQLMVIASSVLIVAATVFSTTRSTEFHLKQTYWAYQQLDAINSLTVCPKLPTGPLDGRSRS